MKILYAAGNREGSYYQYDRFLQSIKNNNIELRTAGYQKSIKNLNADYTLDALLNFSNNDARLTYNGNYIYYYKQIQSFAPDLIISDLEIYTSIIALELKIQLWQVSSFLLYWSLPDNTLEQMGLWSKYSYIFELGHPSKRKQINQIISQSNKRYTISHLCDTIYSNDIKSEFEWIRPEFELNEVVSNVSQGYEISTADLFYNQHKYKFDIDHTDPEAVLLSETEKFYNKDKYMDIQINEEVKFLPELLK